MPNDLYYFYESDLNRGNLVDFENSLPNHLRNMLRHSMGGVSVLDRDITNVLQGYHGPHNNGASGDSEYLGPSNGLQKVEYWWGVSKHFNWVPVAGWITFAAARAVGDTKWHSLYFDSKTGECLSHNKEIAASKLNDIGRQLFDSSKFNEAKEYFSNAYTHSNNKVNYDVYKNNENKAQTEVDAIKLNVQGDDLFNQGKYGEAQSKYQAAYDKSQVSNQYNKYSASREKAKTEIEAINLNSQGDILFNQGKYNEAQNKYQAAYDKSQVSNQYNKYSASREKAKTEIEAINLNSQGDILFNQGKYNEAQNKYQAAYDKSQVSNQYNKYSASREKAKTEIEAINLNSQGDILFNQGKYNEAQNKYQAAYDKSQVSNQYNKYSANRHKARAELEAIELNYQGDDLFNQGKYNKAQSKYQEAYNKSQVNEQRNKYENNNKKVQVELNALNSYQHGEKLFSEGKYSEALKEYQTAYGSSKVIKEKSTYNNGMIKARAEINAKQLYEKGEVLYSAGNYVEAKMKYNEAVHASNVNKDHYHRTGVKKAQAELDAGKLNDEGNTLFTSGDFTEAKDKYQQAYNISEVAKKNDGILGRLFYSPHEYKSNKDKAQVELDAIVLNGHASILFNQGKFAEAIIKYQEAYDKSQVPNQRNKYKSSSEIIQAKIYNKEGYQLLGEARSEVDINVKMIKYKNAQEKFEKAINICPNNDIYKNSLTKALNSIDAFHCNSEGDQLFEQGEYKAALDKYQTAHDKSQITKEKGIYALNRDKVQTIIDLDKLWNKTWDAENDEENDRYEEAKENFQKVLNKATGCLEIFPDNPKLKQYETLALLKIEGNEFFNQAIELQKEGIEILKEAQELRQKQKYELANIKFNEAKEKFNEAKEKFTIGSKSDQQRFTPCIKVVQDQIEEVTQSINNIDHILNTGSNDLNVNISNNNHPEPDFHESNIIGDQNDYYKQVL
ncbi:hypothetical protein [Candidatus Tisiphia endosymbiont of Mystacides longicornis]|uniref:hypothetical protein n=1 Tax=Candidatus Tisiphia endosymbiont of Mystacides longicornis TaxID=3139330 RepID=UPI003CCA9B46